MSEKDDIESIKRIISARISKQESEQFMKDFEEHPFLPVWKRIDKLQDLIVGWYLNPIILKLFKDSETLRYIKRLNQEIDKLESEVKSSIIAFEKEKEKQVDASESTTNGSG